MAGDSKAENDPVMRFRIAEVYMESQQWDKALNELVLAEELFERSKEFPDVWKQRIWFGRALVHKVLFQYPMALIYIRKADSFPKLTDVVMKEDIMFRTAELLFLNL